MYDIKGDINDRHTPDWPISVSGMSTLYPFIYNVVTMLQCNAVNMSDKDNLYIYHNVMPLLFFKNW